MAFTTAYAAGSPTLAALALFGAVLGDRPADELCETGLIGSGIRPCEAPPHIGGGLDGQRQMGRQGDWVYSAFCV